uniref:GST C-terminal domain-containing protein n=1 Tax=Leptobrachium leishanense TaxID=445787 RepID=A0A8C5RBD5_9ANUR
MALSLELQRVRRREARAKVNPKDMTLYYTESHWQLLPILITAKHRRMDLQLHPVPSLTNQAQRPFVSVLKKPKYVEDDGLTLHGYQCIISYIAPGSLQGDGLRQKTLIQLWLRFAEREIVPLLYICVYPLLGILPVLAQPMERAMGAFKKVMSVLETQLRTRTYMVGERLSLADITLVSALVMPYLLVFDPTFRQPYGSVSRWFMMCVNIPAFAEVLGHVTLCEEPMRYGEGNVVSITFPIRRPEEAAEDAEVEVEEAAEVEVEAAEVEVVEEQAAAGEEPAHGNNSDHEE